MRRAWALIGAAVLLILAGCGPRPSVEIRVMPTPTAAVERAVSDSDREPAFVLNPSSGKFHRPGCTWAEKIAEDRRIDWTGDRADLLAVGYEPCHFCEP